MTDEELETAIRTVRVCIEPVGPIHPMWEVVFDGEAILKGKRSIASREVVEQYLANFIKEEWSKIMNAMERLIMELEQETIFEQRRSRSIFEDLNEARDAYFDSKMMTTAIRIGKLQRAHASRSKDAMDLLFVLLDLKGIHKKLEAYGMELDP